MSAPAEGSSRWLTFDLGGAEYALPVGFVREVVEYAPLARLPATPSFVCGVLDLRGSMVPVIDLADRLGLGAGTITRRSCILLLDLELGERPALVGALVDGVRDLVDADRIDGADVAGGISRLDLEAVLGVIARAS